MRRVLATTRERKLQAFEIKTDRRHGCAVFCWRGKGRFKAEQPDWSKTYGSYASCSTAAMSALGIDLYEKES